MIDFQKIIKTVSAEMTPAQSGTSVEISEALVMKRAREMAEQGYRPTEGSVKALEQYLKGYGLWLSGNVGTGKTEFFKKVRPMKITNPKTHEVPRIVIFSMLGTLGMTIEDLDARLEYVKNEELVLDDVGAEPVFNFYGGKFEILPYILEKRIGGICRTHITTNQKPRELAERYGVRVLDRFSELFVNVDFNGKSMRRAKPNERIVNAYQEFKTRGNEQ